MLVGGGTGGHIMPLLAVANELKNIQQDIKIIAVIDKSTQFGHILKESQHISDVIRISAGKFRRYHNQSLITSLLDIKTNMLNIRDVWRTLTGYFEALKIIKKYQPSVIFIKGGFVSVPVGLAAWQKKIPYVTHDSDAQPGLANRIIARWSKRLLVGMPEYMYSYPKSKVRQVGIPVSKDYGKISIAQKQIYRKQIGITNKMKLILVIGGSQGSQQINQIIANNLKELLKKNTIMLIHQTGLDINKSQKKLERYRPIKYIDKLHIYSAAADLVITRAGSIMAELARQAKSCIVIPAPHLAGGHQLKNAEILVKNKAAIVLDENDLINNPQKLSDTIQELINDTQQLNDLGINLQRTYPDGAAKNIAEELFKVIDK